MPVHDWTRVDAGIFHAFHHDWITELSRALNRGLLPSGYYSLPEQIAGGLEPDVLALRGPTRGEPPEENPPGVLVLAEAPPRVQFRARAELDVYAGKAKAVVIRHTSGHQVIAVIEIVSPGNKHSRHGLQAFVRKAEELLRAGIHLLVVDLLPPGPRDPQGMGKAVWDAIADNDYVLPPGKQLSVASFTGGPAPEVFLEPVAVGGPLPRMPLFLTPGNYVEVPLEATYQAAWEGVPEFWREVLTTPRA